MAGMRRFLAVGLLALLLVPAARADITVRLDRSSARVGDTVRATSVACCYLSLYLVPERLDPHEYACRRHGQSAICAAASLGPPRRRNWTWRGRFFPHRADLWFRVPRVRPGAYRAVVYCPPCYKGPRGSLIAGDSLRVTR